MWSKASHLMSRKWAFCGMMCNLLCKSRKTIHEKSRFKALKTWIIYFFECNNLLRIQDGPFNPKYLHFDFWFDTPLEQCAGVNPGDMGDSKAKFFFFVTNTERTDGQDRCDSRNSDVDTLTIWMHWLIWQFCGQNSNHLDTTTVVLPKQD